MNELRGQFTQLEVKSEDRCEPEHGGFLEAGKQLRERQ
jgi:hypothetical protein